MTAANVYYCIFFRNKVKDAVYCSHKDYPYTQTLR